jgi:phage terminase large subunit GpA-like protein
MYQLSALLQALKKVAKQTLKPKPNLTLSGWADEFRRLSQESAAEPGRWRTSRVPYMKEIMDCISDSSVSETVIMVSSQMGKTELLLNTIGYYAHLEPSPILLIQPTEGAAAAFSKERIQPMIRDTPAISDLFNSDSYGDSANTILHKSYPGGFIALAGSNSPTSLAGRPIRILLLDEIDRYPPSAKTEGDPVDIVRRRSQNFHDSKFIAVSTPTVTGSSKIDTLYLDSDQRKWHIECIHCSDHFYPKWEHVTWNEPEDAMIVCPSCGGLHNDNERLVASSNGKWVADNPGHRTPGFHTNALVSPWTKLKDMVYEFIACDNQPSKLQPFHNTVLGLPFEFSGEAVGDLSVSQRVEHYDKDSIPNDVIILTAGCDVQLDRIECEILGHTADGRTYNVEYLIIPGDTKTPDPYEDLKTELIEGEYTRQDGIKLSVMSTLIDSGYNTRIVYKFTEANKAHRIYSCKGAEGPRAMIVQSQSKFGASFYKVGIDIYKEQLYNNLQITDSSKDGYCHFPDTRNQDYFIQLCQSETRTYTTDKRGQKYWHYEKKDKNGRNEALDVRVYAMAAFELVKRVTKKNAEYGIKKQLVEKEQVNTAPVSESIAEPEVINTDIKLKKRSRYDGFFK